VVTNTVTCYSWAPSGGDHLFTCGAIFWPPQKGPSTNCQNKAGPDMLRLLEHELIQSEFHPTPEQIEEFYKNVGVRKPYL